MFFNGEIIFREVHAGGQDSREFSGTATEIGQELSLMAKSCGCDCCTPTFYGVDDSIIYLTTHGHPLGADHVMVKMAGQPAYIATVL